MMLSNVKDELENNEQIISIFGIQKTREAWGSEKIILANGVCIMARSRGQKIRGLRHRQYRPDLIVVDDPEDIEWVQQKKNRDNTERWFLSQVVLRLKHKGRVIVIGNMLHTDSLSARLKKNKRFKTLEYPIIKDGKCLWSAKFPTRQSLIDLRDTVGPVVWSREMKLQCVPDGDAPVHPEWIRYYDDIPKEFQVFFRGAGVDLAISEKQTADFTTIVEFLAGLLNGKPKIYIMPNPVNEHLSLFDLTQRCKMIASLNKGILFYVEGVAYQQAAIETLQREWLSIETVHPIADKRARLKTAAPKIQDGTVEFPRYGCEDLLIQLLNFGVEQYDDLVDALVYAILGASERGLSLKVVRFF